MKKWLIALGLILLPSLAFAQLTTQQGGTGTTSPFGILVGDQTLHLKTLTIGSGLNLSGTTLAVTSVGSASSTLLRDTNTFSGIGNQFTNLLTTAGLISTASSTIGDGSNGLTINGNATTTGTSIINGQLGIELNNNNPIGDIQVGSGATSQGIVSNGDSTLVNLSGYFETPYFSVGEYTNFLLQSESFDNASWVKTGVGTVTANTAAAPDGTAIAENIGAGVLATDGVRQTITNSTVGYWNFSVWLRAQTSNPITTTTLDIDWGNGTATTSATQVVNLTTNWQRYAIATNITTAHTLKTVQIQNGPSAISAWGAQLDFSTTTRAYSGPTTITAVTTLTRTTHIREGVSFNANLVGITTIANAGTITNTLASLSTSTLNTADGLLLNNTTAATALIPNQESSRVRFQGTIWNGAASIPVTSFVQLIPAAFTLQPTATTSLQFGFSYNGLSTTTPLTLTANNIGVGTTSPFAQLSIQANANSQYPTRTLFAIGSSTASATTTLFSVLNNGTITSNSIGTSTFTNGLNLSAGCFAVNGTCLSTTGGSSASSTLLGDTNTFSGNDTFSNTITGSISGNAGTATKLQTGRTINSVTFDGTSNITINAASSSLLGDANTFSGVNKFTNVSSDFSGTWQTFSPSHFDTFAYPFIAGATSSPLMLLASTTIGNGTVTGGLTISGTATTSNFINTNITSALALFDANHKETAYGGASACSTNNWVTTISSVGGTTCGAIGANGLTLSMFPTIGANTIIGNLTGGTATPTALATSSLFNFSTAFVTNSGQLQNVTYQTFGYFSTTTSGWLGTSTNQAEIGYGETWSQLQCSVASTGAAGFLGIDIQWGSNHMNFVYASSTIGTTTLSTNNTVPPGQLVKISIGTTTSNTITSLICTVKKTL